jgi:16S rRNA (cytosine967-C5)-methyltransferase
LDKQLKESFLLFAQERKNVFRTQAFQDGFFEVQDLSSQLVAAALQVQAGMRVFDVCAGAGGVW